MIDLSSLNPEQRRVVEAISGPLLVLAGAGTGKTKALTMRIAYMISMGIPPESIVAMTFTNKAAREMGDRIEGLVGTKTAGKINLGTFHSFCLRILRQYGEHVGLATKFSLAGTGDQIDLLRRALQEDGALGQINVEALHSEISRAKNALLTPAEFAKRAVHISMGVAPEQLVRAYELYERQLGLNRLIDFDDCIFKTVRLLEENPDVREKLEKRFRYYLVDEFQDTNSAQLRIIELLGSGHKNVCVVGDDDQSIYSWRGALFETLERFEQMFSGAELIKLEQNYRCTNTILEAANTVIKNNSKRKDKTLWSNNDGNWPIEISRLDNEEEEARFVADKCLSLVGEGYKAGDIAILYRANNQARLLELALREIGIPYETFGGSSFFERKEVKDFLAYVRIIVRPNDRLAFYRVINTPNRGIGLKSLEKIEASSVKHALSPWAVAKNHTEELGLTGKSLQSLRSFLQDLESLRNWKLEAPEDVAALGNEIIKRFHLASDIRAHVKDPASQERKIEALKSLPRWLASAARDVLKEKANLDVDDLLDRLTMNDRDFSDRDEDGFVNRISLMTVHASKGLEFPVVFVSGMEEDLFPHKNSAGNQNGLMEERRLFYVAVTRAKRKLTLSWAGERGNGPMKSSRIASRFLAELPETSCVGSRNDGNAADRLEARKAKTVSSLQNLRESLKGRAKTR